ncbi:MAG: four helix bundle protein [Planctomycetota bacterium]
MGTIRRYQDLVVWQRARELAKFVNQLTLLETWRGGAKLKDQILDSSASSPANVAEGFERNGNAEFINALGYAKGSAGETSAHLYTAFNRGYIGSEDLDQGVALAAEVCNLAGGLMVYLERSGLRGPKFRHREGSPRTRPPRPPDNPHPKPATPNPTRNPEPGTLNSTSGTPNAKPPDNRQL